MVQFLSKIHRKALEVFVNDLGDDNGFMKVYVNESLRIEASSIMFRTKVASNESLLVSDIAFSTFFGGSTAEWASPSDTYSLFKNFEFMAGNTNAATGIHFQSLILLLQWIFIFLIK